MNEIAKEVAGDRRRGPARGTSLVFLAVLTVAAGCGSSSDVSSSPVTASGPTTTSVVEPTPTTGLSATTSSSAPVTPTTAPRPTTSTTRRATTSTSSPTSTTVSPASSSAVAKSGGLTVTLTASPAQASSGQTVQLSVVAEERAARGALAYRLSYGDGATDQNVVAQFCLGGAGSPQSEHWLLTHRYATAGRHVASVTVTANCTPDQATATVPIAIT